MFGKRYILIPAAALFAVFSVKGASPANDSLSLNAIISEVVQNHPLVKKASEELTVSDARIGIAQSAYLPNVDFDATYTHIGPVPAISFEGMNLKMAPSENYNAAFNMVQKITDFKRTDKSIAVEKQGKELTRQSIEQVKQKLSQAAIGNYFALLYLQEAIKIKDEQLNTLNEHLRYVKKKQETGSATQYEILTTQVRISAIENQKTDLEVARQTQISQLNALLGKPESTSQQVKNDLNISLMDLQNQALINTAMQNRDEMKLAREKAKLAEMKYSLTGAQNNASINAFLQGGIKDGYFPSLYKPAANYAVGVSVKVPIFDGKRSKYNLVQAKSAIISNDQEAEYARRTIVNEVVESSANVKASQKKVEQSELQLRQATEAYKLAQNRFSAGVITNLELLDGSTAVSESRLMLLKSKIDYTVNLYKLKSAVGERLY
jgi:Outer membrane protein